MQLDHLNQQQREAVLSDDPSLLILAGAGSGKTRVLTMKIERLIKEKHVNPWSILAFTFTNKAAHEMRDRVEQALGESTSGMWMGTFHSICARLLRREIAPLGWTSDFTIYDTGDQKQLIKEIMKSLMVGDRWSPRSLLSKISAFKNEGRSVADVEKEAVYDDDRMAARVYRRYEAEKKKNNALDFDDLILKAIEVLQDPAIRARYHQRFSHIFVDEYQDTNHPQYTLTRLLTGANASICVVGDADQSIYGWRGADIQNILRFEKDFPGAKVLLLEQNYRSTQSILDAANQLIQNNAQRLRKTLWTSNGDGDKVHFRRVQSEHEEAVLIAARIRKEEERGVKLSDMAILYRTNAQSRAFEDIFLREGIAYRVIGGLKFYDRAEIKDLVSYMNLVVNPLDDVAFRRVVNQPKRSIGQQTIERLATVAEENGMSLMQALQDGEALEALTNAQRAKLLPFRDLIETLAEEASGSITAFVQSVYEKSGYRRMLERANTVEDRARMDNVGAFLDAVASYEEEEADPSLVDYLQNLSLLSDVDKTEEAARGVNLLTIHSAKGLEWPVVFVVGLEEGLFPSKRTMDEGNVEEERRLMYVAMTRAMQRLYLTQAESRRVFGQPMMAQPSRFLKELEGKIEVEDTEFVTERTNVYDRGYAPRSGFADPKLRAAYDKKREAFREMIREKKEKTSTEAFRVGDKIRHKKFGTGTVVSVVPHESGDEVTVAFDAKGLKRLNAQLAPMQKL